MFPALSGFQHSSEKEQWQQSIVTRRKLLTGTLKGDLFASFVWCVSDDISVMRRGFSIFVVLYLYLCFCILLQGVLLTLFVLL